MLNELVKIVYEGYVDGGNTRVLKKTKIRNLIVQRIEENFKSD